MDLDALGALGVGEELIAKRERLDGERALRFLAELPSLVSASCDQLGLSSPRIMPGGVLSAALACRRDSDGVEVVLKLSARDATGARAEAAALAVWEGLGACELLDASERGDAMVLEAIRPGTAVTPGPDDATDARCAGRLLATLHRIPAERRPAAVPDAVEELRWRFERAHKMLDGPSHARDLVSHNDIDHAFGRALELHRGRAETVMCHGDFMNKNLLIDRAGRWRAIDPRPCLADPCLDAGFWALAHRPGIDVRERCDLVARERSLDVDRVWAWARAFAVSEAVLVTEAARARAHHSVLLG